MKWNFDTSRPWETCRGGHHLGNIHFVAKKPRKYIENKWTLTTNATTQTHYHTSYILLHCSESGCEFVFTFSCWSWFFIGRKTRPFTQPPAAPGLAALPGSFVLKWGKQRICVVQQNIFSYAIQYRFELINSNIRGDGEVVRPSEFLRSVSANGSPTVKWFSISCCQNNLLSLWTPKK